MIVSKMSVHYKSQLSMSIVYVRWRQVQGLVLQEGTNFPTWFRVAALPAEQAGEDQRKGH